MEIIPAIDIIEGKTVRLTLGDYERITVYNADAVDMVKRFVDHGLTRIHAVDLDGARVSEPRNTAILEKMASVSEARIEWSGGLKTTDAVMTAFNSGATYVCAGSIAVDNPELFNSWLKRFGSSKIILGADVKGGRIAVKGWTGVADETLSTLLPQFIPAGLEQVIVTDISRDGMLRGIDTAFYVGLEKEFPGIIFTVSGGVSGIADIEAATEAGLKRIIVGKAIYEGRVTLKQLEEINNP